MLRLWDGIATVKVQTVIALMCVVVFACSHRDGPFKQTEGRHFDHTNVASIVDGRTTEQEVIQWFGQPLKVRQLDGKTRQIDYLSIRQRESIEGFLFWKQKHVQTWDQRLTLVVTDNVVQKHDYVSKSD